MHLRSDFALKHMLYILCEHTPSLIHHTMYQIEIRVKSFLMTNHYT